ncbi:MAG TPA: hypothetical protein VJA21_07090 [Verrucomicrobiae bacterium]
MKKLVLSVMVVVAVACFAYRSGGQGTQYAPLEVFTNGPGRISPLYAGQLLEVWQTYRMAATPEPGAAFYNWEYVDVFIRTTRLTNDSGGVITNVQRTVTSKNQFFLSPELIFTTRPVFVTVHSDQLTTTSAYGWRANFGPVREPVEPDVYRTMAGAVAQEYGDGVPSRSRLVPISATLAFDFSTTPPSLTAEIPNAVLEGGAPFALTVRSYYGYRLSNGAYRFSGDYLRDIYPTGSQYGFDWEFSAPTNGSVVWNGTAGWSGGHIWNLSVSNLTLVPQARLTISRAGPTAFQVSWRTNFSDYVLEDASTFPAGGWSLVTNAPAAADNRYSVTMDMNAGQRFYRLRKL